jgi:hypothetical protein
MVKNNTGTKTIAAAMVIVAASLLINFIGLFAR